MKNKTKKHHIKGIREGYTLLELIVAIGIFSIGLAIVVGVFTQALRTQRSLNALMQAQSNASITLEQIMREIRAGFNFTSASTAGSVCNTRGLFDSLTFSRFINNEKVTVSYEWSGSSITRTQTGSGGNVTTSVMNDASVLINSACFDLSQSNQNSPWKIGFFASISPSDSRISDRIVNVETTVSARILPEETPQ